MQFGKKLLAQKYEPWSFFYLEYEMLKDVLNAADDGGANEKRLLMESASHAERSLGTSSDNLNSMLDHGPDHVTIEFLGLLHTQLEKIMIFVLEEQGKIASQLATCRKKTTSSSEVNVDDLYDEYQQAGTHILRLVEFLDLNVSGIRKILKKHDKLQSTKLSRAMFLTRHTTSSRLQSRRLVEPLLKQDHNLGALTAVLEAGLMEIHLYRQTNQFVDPYTWTGPQNTKRGRIQGLKSESSIPSIIEAGEPFTLNKRINSGTDLQSLEVVPQFFNLLDVTRRKELILSRIEAARAKLSETNSFVEMLASTMLLEEARDRSETESVGTLTTEDEKKPLSDSLNLMSTFLYMANYYIIAPTSGDYAEKLGGDASMASLIIGMTPVAALVSTVLFSWWTSHSYKHALLFASACSFLGNVLYAAGLPCGSLRLVLIGRLLNGFGSARSINRRYIADRFSRKERTSASATFVTAGALGMAAGPAIAALLKLATPNDPSNIYLQVENAPGYFMMVVWAIFLVAMVMGFENPPKRQPLQPTTASGGEVNGESTPLVKKTASALVAAPENETMILQNVPALATFAIYFVLKLLLESMLSSASTISSYYFDWDSSVIGIYLALMGLLMLPANLVVSLLAKRYDDRELIIGLQAFMFLGCIGVLQYSPNYPLLQYLFASVVIFVSTNALEGPNMSLLSKTIPASWSRGFFNVGLLATEAGTLGRAVGDVLLTFFAGEGVEHLLNRAFGSLSALCGLTLFASIALYEQLDEPPEKDE